MNKVTKLIVLEYPGAIYSKKNSKRIITNPRTGRPQIVSNQNAKDQETEMLWIFRTQLQNAKDWEIFEEAPGNYEGRYFELDVEIWQPDRVRRDLDNQLTAILDGLVGAGAIPDDSNRFLIGLSVKDMGLDRENPRARITISEVING